jgi:hypothetical protein
MNKLLPIFIFFCAIALMSNTPGRRSHGAWDKWPWLVEVTDYDRSRLDSVIYHDHKDPSLFLILPKNGKPVTDQTKYKYLKLISKNDKAKLSIRNARLPKLEVNGNYKEVMITDSRLNSDFVLTDGDAVINSFTMVNDTVVGNITFQTDEMDKLTLDDCHMTGSLDLSGLNIYEPSTVSGILKGQLDLSGLKLYGNGSLDITFLKRDSSFHGGKIPIKLNRATISKIDLDYKNFKLVFDKGTDSTVIDKTYEDLLFSLKQKGRIDDYNTVTREYRHFKEDKTQWGRFKNKLIDERESYGTDLTFMLLFSGSVFTLFFIINIFWYRRLNVIVYQVVNLRPQKSQNKWVNGVRHLYYSFIYTSVIFINPLLKLENLYYRKLIPLMWVIFMYLSGLFLLYYIVHYLLKFD